MTDEFARLPNKVKYYRESVLGLRKTELAELIKDATKGNKPLSVRTIWNVENLNRGTRAIRTKILRGINLGLEGLRSHSPLNYEELYPSGDTPVDEPLAGSEKKSDDAANRKPAKKR